MTGAVGYHGGLAAEQIAENAYVASGHEVLARRWRGDAGEIDLIARRGDVIRFVEVKKARTHARAAERVSPRQRSRIMLAAQEFAGACASGLESEMQFDVALVDGLGRLEIVEAAFF
ncbi:MAG: YraN family protein [Rhodobacteraceae bacterium]|nr:YraN family protein [Paracoccaceae bacterium]